MSSATGRREANKQATRAALRHAAERLFAEQGYEATTVAQIAATAHVGERTFYRYFASKEELLAGRAMAWIDALQQAIRQRPAHETPYQAVARAMTAAVAELNPGADGAWILNDSPQPLALLRNVQPKPARRLRRAIFDAVLARRADASARSDQPPADHAARFEAELLARVSLAALRTAASSLQQEGKAVEGRRIDCHLREAFSRLSDLTGSQPFPTAHRPQTPTW